ncbi:IKS1 [Candida margitis]|uniref:IKS1 n=1 Tax=Candida margitis TaxID=1775924 RepID=UPI0022277A6D|nr:IKS1 [Candida margitis]KAI5969160.1 IKS1 [Candida margitis]
MSIVPYNPNNDILYHNPDDGVLILHDTKENSIQLLSTLAQENRGSYFSTGASANGFSNKRFPSFADHADIRKCPSCGFTWNEFDNRDSRRRSSVGTKPPISNTTHLNDSTGGFSKPFMRTDYFKLLAQIPHSNKERSKTNTTGIPAGIFNQGYFNRFFNKIGSNPLGSGARAQVYKVEHVFNDIALGTYAVKRISIGNKFEHLEQMLNEVLILYELSAKSVSENNLIRYNHVWLELGDLEDSSSFFLQTDCTNTTGSQKVPYMFILQQYCDGGHLEGIIEKNFPIEENLSYSEKIKLEKRRRKLQRSGKEDEEEEKRKWLSNFEIWKFFHDIANGVNYLHKNGILHRDLKPSNCLADVQYSVDDVPESFDTIEQFEEKVFELPKILVSDFGEGKFTDKHKNTGLHKAEEREGNTGTLEFTAPELWLCSDDSRFINEFSYDSDIYSLGLILCYLCVGTLPFADSLRGETDPEVSREKIQDWYRTISYESFGSWFETALTKRKRLMDNLMSDFKWLIYEMIKGNSDITASGEEISRLNSKEVLAFLNEMKWKRFIKSSLAQEEDINQRNPSLSDSEKLTLYLPRRAGNQPTREDSFQEEEEEEEEEEDLEYEKENETDHLDLTEEEYEPQTIAMFDYTSESSKHKFLLERRTTLPLYCLELLVLEYMSIHSPNVLQIILKLAIYATITLDLFLERCHFIRSSLFALIFVSLCIVLAYTIWY